MITLLAQAATESDEGGFYTPYIVGVSAFVILLVLVVAVIIMGNGREHS